MAAKRTPKLMSIKDARHPEYVALWKDWEKWRLTYRAGDDFLDKFLKKFSARESNKDFNIRRAITPIPAFAKAAINDIKNSIFQRMSDITREGGSESYQNAIRGLDNGVDLRGSTMNSYVGQNVLPDLLVMGRVGVYVDMPEMPENPSLLDAQGKRPYIYMYTVEDILSWTCSTFNRPDEFQSVLLRDRCLNVDPDTLLTLGSCERYRHVWINRDTGFVNIQFYDANGGIVDRDGFETPGAPPMELKLTTIPFVMADIKQSLIEDVANHQIALLNLGSSDVAYALKANFPFYVEQADLRQGSNHLLPGGTGTGDGSAASADQARDQEINVGPVQGRAYDLQAETPSFIHPSPEPLQASMELQAKLKEDIRQLVNLAVTNLNPKMASAESKSIDMQGLESGLSYIGLVLENVERRIARFWAMYENNDVATVKYPEKYDLKSDAERRQEAKDHAELMFKVPSRSFQRRIAKDIINILQGSKVSIEELADMYKEVDAANYATSDPDIIASDVEMGVVGLETASLARGYDPDEAEKAKADRVEKLKEVATFQAKTGMDNAGARGIPEADTGGQSSQEKDGKPQRGEGSAIQRSEDE